MDKVVEKKLEFSERQLDMLKNMTVLELAQELESGLLHTGTIKEDLSVYDYLQYHLLLDLAVPFKLEEQAEGNKDSHSIDKLLANVKDGQKLEFFK